MHPGDKEDSCDVRDIAERKITKDREKRLLKGEIDSKQCEMEAHLDIIRDGVESRLVECIEKKDFQKYRVDYVYDGKVMESRAMEMGERQLELVPKDRAAEGQDQAKGTLAHV
jgi:hypothetical protein